MPSTVVTLSAVVVLIDTGPPDLPASKLMLLEALSSVTPAVALTASEPTLTAALPAPPSVPATTVRLAMPVTFTPAVWRVSEQQVNVKSPVVKPSASVTRICAG